MNFVLDAEKMAAKMAAVGQKIKFLAVAMATAGPIWLKLKRALFQPGPSLHAKFQPDRPSGLGWRAVRNTHTDKQASWLTGVTG